MITIEATKDWAEGRFGVWSPSRFLRVHRLLHLLPTLPLARLMREVAGGDFREGGVPGHLPADLCEPLTVFIRGGLRKRA